MKSSKTIWHTFGDESAFDHIITYAIIGVRPEMLRKSEVALEAIKKDFGASADTRLHCRQMFTPAAKAKSGWNHLSAEKVQELILNFAQKIHQLDLRRTVGIVYKATAPKELPGVGSVQTPLPLGDKQLCTFAFVGAFAPVMQQTGAKGIRLWVDKDTTKIDWWGKKRQAGLTRELTSLDFGMKKISPEFVAGSSSVMLEAADLLAYTVGKIRGSEQKNDFFEEILKILAPAEGVMEWPQT